MALNTEIEKLERRWLENPLGLTFATLAEAYRKAGDPVRALEVLEVGLAQHPNYMPAHIVQGRCHLDAHADAQAEGAFLRVIELDRENVIALTGLAELAERAGRLPEAIERLELLLEIDRNNEDARGQLERVRELLAGRNASASEPTGVAEAAAVADAAELATGPDVSALDAPVLEETYFEAISALDPEDIRPDPGSEFLIPNDSEALEPASDRIPDVVLSAETPELEGLLGGDYASLIAFDDPPASVAEVLEPEPEPPSDPEPRPEPEPIVAEAYAAIVEVTLPPTAAPEGPEVTGESEAAAESEAQELVVTETMAEIFLRQGHRELALAVYQQLAVRDPANEKIAEAVTRLRPEPVASEPPPEMEPERVYAASRTGGRSVGELLGLVLGARRPAVAAGIHPPAFDGSHRTGGDPTRPAQEMLSLSAVFGDEGGPAPPASPLPGPVDGEPSFDEFFSPATGSSADSELPRPPAEAGALPGQVPEDLEQFNAWLRGLKR